MSFFLLNDNGHAFYTCPSGSDLRATSSHVMTLINWIDRLIDWWFEEAGYKPEMEVSKGADRISNTESHVASSTLRANFIPSLLAGGRVLGFLWWRKGLSSSSDSMLSLSVLIKARLPFGESSVNPAFPNMLYVVTRRYNSASHTEERPIGTPLFRILSMKSSLNIKGTLQTLAVWLVMVLDW